MSEVIHLPQFKDSRGCLTVIEKCLPFNIKRVYWLSDFAGQKRGGHRHINTYQAAICVSGTCRFTILKHAQEQMITLENNQQCLLLPPEDWHSIDAATPNTVLLMLASHEFDKNDYLLEPLS